MTFNDIFKSSFLESVTSFSVTDTLLGMLCALILGLFIFLVYKKTSPGILYSSSFGLTLIGLSLVTTLVIMAVTSNVILSLGMVGALSIVRFRAAIKEPIEIVYLFWSLASGIVVGAGLIPLAVFGSIGIGAVLYAFAKKKTVDSPYILVLHCENGETEERARAFVQSQVKRLNLKSKSVDEGRIELNYEVRLREDSSAFVNELEAMAGVSRVVLVSYNGDYMG